jgi:hypothetical protein
MLIQEHYVLYHLQSRSPMGSAPQADGHNGPGLIHQLVSRIAAVIDDVAA